MNVQEEIREYFMMDRSYTGGLTILSRVMKNAPMIQRLNIKGETPDNLAIVYYQLSKAASMSESECQELLSFVPAPEITYPESMEERLILIPDEVKKSIKLRDEFPFLFHKDCPEALKILVANMLTAYAIYKEAHSKLLDATTEEEVSKLSELVVENFLENREIWDELNHYKNTGEILGKHEIFARLEAEKIMEEKLSNYSAIQLSSRLGSLRTYVSKAKTFISDNAKSEEPNVTKKLDEKQEKIKEWEFEISYLEKKMSNG